MEGNKEKNARIISNFKALAGKEGFTLVQLALTWLLKQGDDIIPIPGVKSKMKYIEENWTALDIHLFDETKRI